MPVQKKKVWKLIECTTYVYIYLRRSPYGVVANMLDCNIIVSKLTYIHFQINILLFT